MKLPLDLWLDFLIIRINDDLPYSYSTWASVHSTSLSFAALVFAAVAEVGASSPRFDRTTSIAFIVIVIIIGPVDQDRVDC